MPEQIKPTDLVAIAVVVVLVALALYILFAILGFLSHNIGSILLIAFVGLIASMAWFYFVGKK
jgi:hypothetical protein